MAIDFSRLARKNQIYIIPNGNGVVYLAINGIVLIAAATFANNLIYMLAFLMLAIFLMGMVQSHLNLKGVELLSVQAPDTFANSPTVFLVRVTNTSQQLRQNIWVDLEKKHQHKSKLSGGHIDELMPQQQKVIQVRSYHWTRGVHKYPVFYIKTRYPLGLFTAWKVERPQGQHYVYPEALGEISLLKAPVKGLEDGLEDVGRASRGVEFNEHQRFSDGDSYRHVDWKVYARKRIWLKKKFEGEGDQVFNFDWSKLPYKDQEKRLNQLSKWIKEAHEKNIPFSLQVQNTKVLAGFGQQHFVKAQRLLAAFPREAS